MAEMTRESTGERALSHPDASEDRRTGVGSPSAASLRVSAMRAAQVVAVGRAFLRARPFIVAPVAAVNGALLARAHAPEAQRLALAGGMGAFLVLFSVEAYLVARVRAGERWLTASLAITLLGLAAGCAISGGVSSPMLPLLLAPVVVSFAAFGKRPATAAMLLLAALLGAALAAAPRSSAFPEIDPSVARWMRLASFVGAAALAYAGVAGLAEAFTRAGEALDRMRLATLEEAASRMRATEQVGAKVAHELKNPLAAIKAIVQLLGERDADEKSKKRVDVALGEIDRMDHIVRDYLAFARPLADLRPEPTDLSELARDVVAVLEARALEAQVTLSAIGPEARVVVDPRRVREALLNLADNALAATPAGGSITLAVAREGSGARVEVDDTGRGLPPEVAAAPGRPYVTTRKGGTGLGLTIARAAIEQHGGSLRFETSPRGTKAVVTLPSQEEK
jgi:signal transduction histidine kinase